MHASRWPKSSLRYDVYSLYASRLKHFFCHSRFCRPKQRLTEECNFLPKHDQDIGHAATTLIRIWILPICIKKNPPAALVFLFPHNLRVFNVFFCLYLVSKMWSSNCYSVAPHYSSWINIISDILPRDLTFVQGNCIFYIGQIHWVHLEI